MAGFFSLGSAANPQQQQQDLNPPQALIPPEKWFQLRNEDLAAAATTTTTAFELWHHQQADHERINSSSNLYYNRLGFGVGVGVGHTETEANNSRLSDDQTTSLPMMMMMQQGGGSSDGRRGSISCQDCGNQAKKECVHMRCRTCCKSRGFECQTHVKSTWVPASKRRDRQQQQQQQIQLKRIRHDPNSTAAAAASNSSLACGSSSRLAPSPSALAAGGGMEAEKGGRMPPEVMAAAVFKCVRVSPIDQGEERLEQVAYQTSVTIGGHLFRGILYDQGPENYQQQSHYATDVVGSYRISNASNTQQHASFAVDPRNVYQATNADPNTFPGGSVGAHFFP